VHPDLHQFPIFNKFSKLELRFIFTFIVKSKLQRRILSHRTRPEGSTGTTTRAQKNSYGKATTSFDSYKARQLRSKHIVDKDGRAMEPTILVPMFGKVHIIPSSRRHTHPDRAISITISFVLLTPLFPSSSFTRVYENLCPHLVQLLSVMVKQQINPNGKKHTPQQIPHAVKSSTIV